MDSVSLPLDEIDADVQGLDDVMATWATGDALPDPRREGRIYRTRAGGIFYDAGTHWIQLRGEPDPTHVVGAVGEPAFADYWETMPTQNLGFWRDNYGLIHICGSARRPIAANQGVVFTLPVSYRPRSLRSFPITAYRPTAPSDYTTSASVNTNGRVFAGSVTEVGASAYFNVVFDPTR